MNRIIVIVISMIFLFGCAHFQPASLLKSSSTGNLTEIKAYIQSGANINEQDPRYGRTPLMNAIANHKIEAAKYLIQAGANVNIKDPYYGYDALIIAVEMGNDGLEFIDLLLDNGADINSEDLGGWTPIMHTLNAYNTLNAARLLIKRGADLRVKASTSFESLYDMALYYKQPGLAADFKEAMANNGIIKYDSKIVFIRESNPLIIGGYNIEIAIDDRTINMNMSEASSNYIDIHSGKHEVMIKGGFYEGSHKISLDAEPGKTYYFELYRRAGNVAAAMVGGVIGGAIEAAVKGDKAGPVEIIQLEESQAKEKMKALKINR